MPVKPCPAPGCGELVVKGYCPEHAKERERHYKQRGSRGLYRTKRWRTLARSVLNEQPLCAEGCGELATEVDHVTPVEDGGPMWSASNLQGLCKRCHSRKTMRDVRTRTFR